MPVFVHVPHRTCTKTGIHQLCMTLIQLLTSTLVMHTITKTSCYYSHSSSVAARNTLMHRGVHMNQLIPIQSEEKMILFLQVPQTLVLHPALSLISCCRLLCCSSTHNL